jgi:hypothetical protein
MPCRENPGSRYFRKGSEVKPALMTALHPAFPLWGVVGQKLDWR